MIVPFRQAGQATLEEVGGKGRSLIEATQAGFSVPDGVVLSVSFFREWLEDIERSAAWTEYLSATDEELRQRCDGIKARCGALRLTLAQQTALEEALRSFPQGGLYAVRSSSPEEDMEGSSFAGEYETSLGVTSGRLEEAIRGSFASVFDERVVKYKLQRGMRADRPRIAVIVQQQLASEASGVAFSLNPLNNCYDEVVVNSNFGLGETVVAGAVTPDTFVVDTQLEQIVERKIAAKSHALWLHEDGGAREAVAANPESPSLNDTQVFAVAELAQRAEAHYGRPIDIEWAIAEGELFLLQSRPVTAYLALPEEMITEPGEEKYLYLDVIVLSQGFSDSLSVLGGQYWGRMLAIVKPETMTDRGMDGTLLNLCGRQYFHLSNMMSALGARIMPRLLQTYDTPTRKIFESIDLKDYLPAKRPDALKGVGWKMLRRLGLAVRYGSLGLRRPMESKAAYERRAAAAISECQRIAGEGRPFDELVELFLQRFGGLLTALMTIMVPPIVARWRLGRLFKDDDVGDLLVALEMDLEGNPTSEMGHLLFDLASSAEILETKGGEEFAGKVLSAAYSPSFMEAYRDYMDRFGCRGIKEIDVATPRCYENLPAFFDQLRAIDITNQTIRTAQQRRSAAHEALLAIAAKKGKQKKFEKLAEQHKIAGFREAPKYFFIVTVDLLRRRALELGSRFVEEGRLDEVGQVFDLTIDQIAQAEREPDMELLPLVCRNLAPRRAHEQVKSWPRVIDSRGRIFRAPLDDTEDGLVGDPIAPGVVQGRAKVLRAPYEKPLEQGEILVTRASDPGWTPIFINAAAVVLEVGGALQHGAVIAREYGLPCVSGLDGITDVIADGQMIEVDGSSGTVRVIGAEPSARVPSAQQI